MVLAVKDEDFELRIPSPPARRLSRSSIDLRDLEHEKGKIVSQSESVSSICQLQCDNFLRSSGSEPIPIVKGGSTNYFQNVQENFVEQTNNNNMLERSYAIPFFMKNNHSKSDNKNLFNNNQFNVSRTSLSTSVTASKDNQTTNECSLASSIGNSSKQRRKLLVSSESDFFSIIRNNSEKMSEKNHSLISSKNNKSNNTKNLSDSDFLKRDKSKFCNRDNILNIKKAIVNKSDIFELLMNNKHIDFKNLVDNKLAHNNHNNGKILDFTGNIDKPDILVDLFDKESITIGTEKYRENITKAQSDENFLIKNDIQSSKNSTLRQSCNNFINNSMIETTKQLSNKQSNTATSLPPYSDYSQNSKKVLNTSRSIDEIIQMNDKDLENMLLINSMKDISNYDNTLNIKNQLQLTSGASTISLDLVTISKSLETHNVSSKTNENHDHHDNPDSTLRKFKFQLQQPDIIETNQSSGILTIKCESHFNDVGNKLVCDVDVANKKRKSSGVTYNVNVINFQRDDIDPKTDYTRSGGNSGARSNSSTSEIYIFFSFINYIVLYIFSRHLQQKIRL